MIKVYFKNEFFSTIQSPDQLLFLLSVDDSLDPSLFTLHQLDYNAWAKRHFAEFSTKARTVVAEHSDPYKITGWSNKEQRAHRYSANTATLADIAALEEEAARRGKGETAAQLVTKQLEKAALYANFISKIDGFERGMFDLIDATITNAELATLIETKTAEAELELEGFRVMM